VDTEADIRSMKQIESVIIEPETDYVVSYDSSPGRDYYWSETTIYPLDLGAIVVKGHVETSSVGTFPGVNVYNSIVGVPEIGFVAK